MKQWKSIWASLFAVLVISAAHIITPVERILFHIAIRSLYLIPIAYAGFKGGKKYGLMIAFVSALAYVPHFFMKDMPKSFYIENVIGVAVFFLVAVFFRFVARFGLTVFSAAPSLNTASATNPRLANFKKASSDF